MGVVHYEPHCCYKSSVADRLAAALNLSISAATGSERKRGGGVAGMGSILGGGDVPLYSLEIYTN